MNNKLCRIAPSQHYRDTEKILVMMTSMHFFGFFFEIVKPNIYFKIKFSLVNTINTFINVKVRIVWGKFFSHKSVLIEVPITPNRSLIYFHKSEIAFKTVFFY